MRLDKLGQSSIVMNFVGKDLEVEDGHAFFYSVCGFYHLGNLSYKSIDNNTGTASPDRR